MILFVCSQGRLRSRTAELLCLFGGLEARSAGINPDADVVLSDVQVRQADLVVCMEPEHKKAVLEFQHANPKTTVVLGLRDEYDRLEPALCDLLIARMHGLDAAIAEAMEKGLALIESQTYRSALGTHSPARAK